MTDDATEFETCSHHRSVDDRARADTFLDWIMRQWDGLSVAERGTATFHIYPGIPDGTYMAGLKYKRRRAVVGSPTYPGEKS